MLAKKILLCLFISINQFSSALILVTQEEATLFLDQTSLSYDAALLESSFAFQVEQSKGRYTIEDTVRCSLTEIIETCCNIQEIANNRVVTIMLLEAIIQQYSIQPAHDTAFVLTQLGLWRNNDPDNQVKFLTLLFDYLDHSVSFAKFNNWRMLSVVGESFMDAFSRAEELLDSTLFSELYKSTCFNQTIYHKAYQEGALFDIWLTEKASMLNPKIKDFLKDSLFKYCIDALSIKLNNILDAIANSTRSQQIVQPLQEQVSMCLCECAPLYKRLEYIMTTYRVAANAARITKRIEIDSIATGSAFTELILITMLIRSGVHTIALNCIDILYTEDNDITKIVNLFSKIPLPVSISCKRLITESDTFSHELEIDNHPEKKSRASIAICLYQNVYTYEDYQIRRKTSRSNILFICIDPVQRAMRLMDRIWRDERLSPTTSLLCSLCNIVEFEIKKQSP